MIRHSRYHTIDTALIYCIAVFTIIFLSFLQNVLLPFVSENYFSQNEKKIVVFNTSTFSNIQVQGKAYVVYDVMDKQVLASKNKDMFLPLASLTKVMMAITARTHNDRNKKIIIHKESIEGTYDLGLRENQVWKLDELLKYTLVFSSNDGAQAIADNLGGREFFVREMNQDAKRLGFKFIFTHPAGVDENGKIGGLGSALDVAKLFALAYRQFPDIFDATTKARLNVISSTGRITGVPNTNQEVGNFLNLEMSKTGFTDLAGGNLGVIVDSTLGRPVVIVVLGSTHEERFSDVKRLYEALQKSLIR